MESGDTHMTIDELHHEMKLGFQSQDKQFVSMVKTLDECRTDVRAINGRLRVEESWTARGQGAIAVVTALGLGNLAIHFLG